MSEQRAVQYFLNDSPLSYAAFNWPFYRGVEPRAIVIEQSPDKLVKPVNGKVIVSEDARLVELLQTSGNRLKIRAPEKPGRGKENKPFEIVISEIYAQRITLDNEFQGAFVLMDARWLLTRFICPFNFNIKIEGLGYMVGTAPSATEPATLDFALKKIEKLIKKTYDVQKVASILKATIIPDGTWLRGLKLHEAFGRLLELAGVDQTVTFEGKLAITDRKEATDATLKEARLLPVKQTDIRYLTVPGYAVIRTKVLSAPKVIEVPYQRRVQMDAVHDAAATRSSTQARDSANVPKLKLQQVYRWKEGYLTLSEMLTDAFGTAEISDDDIKRLFFSEEWEGTQVSLDPATVIGTGDAEQQLGLRRSVIETIRRDWRRLWRITNFRNDGDWMNIVFGTVNADGTIGEPRVRCQWVDGFVTPQSNTLFDGTRPEAAYARISKNNETDLVGTNPPIAPFTPRWEDESKYILRLVADGSIEEFTFRMPGILNQDIGIRYATADDLAAGLVGTEKDIGQQRVVTRRFVRFVEAALDLRIAIVATRQSPNDMNVFYTKKYQTGIDGADGPDLVIELGNDPTANFESAEAETPLNEEDVKADAEKRAAKVALDYKAKREGTGEAHGIRPIEVLKMVSGPIAEMSINSGTIGPQFVSTTIEVRSYDRTVTLREISQQRKRERVVTGRGRKFSV